MGLQAAVVKAYQLHGVLRYQPRVGSEDSDVRRSQSPRGFRPTAIVRSLTANILSATRLPAKNGWPLVLRPSLATGLPLSRMMTLQALHYAKIRLRPA
jgi:hypothetical protein